MVFVSSTNPPVLGHIRETEEQTKRVSYYYKPNTTDLGLPESESMNPRWPGQAESSGSSSNSGAGNRRRAGASTIADHL